MGQVNIQKASEDKAYTKDWSSDLDSTSSPAETINTSSWSINPTGPTVSDDSDTNTTATAYLTGLTAGEVYLLTNTITTTAAVARTLIHNFTIRCIP